MGLDLLHLKLVMTPVDRADVIYQDELPHDLPPGFSFAPYLQDVDDFETLHTVKFLPDQRTFDWAVARLAADGYAPDRVTYLRGDPASCEAELLALERRLGLQRCQAWLSSASHLHDGQEYRLQFALYSRPIIVKGAYYVEAGYQRKGMSERFFEDYAAAYFAHPERFRALPDYLDESACPQRLANLQANFIDNHETGRSILFKCA